VCGAVYGAVCGGERSSVRGSVQQRARAAVCGSAKVCGSAAVQQCVEVRGSVRQ
jgi:hypothetical protein